jgi:hypothetical protein
MTNFSNKVCLKKIQVISFNSFKSKYQKLNSNFMHELTKTKHGNLKVHSHFNKKFIFETQMYLTNLLLPKKLQDDFHEDL